MTEYLQKLLSAKSENETLEFKEAKNSFSVMGNDDEQQRAILLEEEEDYTAQICPGVTITDLDTSAIQILKQRWIEKSQNKEIARYSNEDVLRKLLLIRTNKVTNAAVLLLGSDVCIALQIPQAELINARNYRVAKNRGFVEVDIWAYHRDSIREGLLNAFAHREYRNRTEPSIIKLTPEYISIKSPGGFILGVNAENALYAEGKWRNRLLMEVLEKVGLVERSGIEFVRYLDKISREKKIDDGFSLQQIIELEHIRSSKNVKNTDSAQFFLELGLIDQVGKGRGIKYILSHNYYESKGKTGEYTRLTGLSRQTKKELILQHLRKNKNGASFDAIRSAFPDIKAQDVSNLLQELRIEGKCKHVGTHLSGLWQLADFGI